MAVKTFSLLVAIGAVDKATAPITRAKGALSTFGSEALKVGKNLTVGLTLPMLALGTSTIGTAARFEKGMNRVRAISGAQGEDFDRLSEKARHLGSTTEHSASAAAEGMGNLAIAGFKVNEILEATPGTLLLASAAQEELGFSAEVAAGTLRAAGKEADQMGQVVDVLANGLTKTGVRLMDLSEAVKTSTPTLSAMGVSLEQNVALVGVLGDNMIKGTLAGNA